MNIDWVSTKNKKKDEWRNGRKIKGLVESHDFICYKFHLNLNKVIS